MVGGVGQVNFHRLPTVARKNIVGNVFDLVLLFYRIPIEIMQMGIKSVGIIGLLLH